MNTEVLATTGMSTSLSSGSAPWAGWSVEGRPAFPGRKQAAEAKLTELGNLSEASTDVKADLTTVIPQPITQSSWRGDSQRVSVLAASEGICLQPPQPELLLIPE